MQILDGRLVYSATDMASAATCEFAVLRALDARLGRVAPLERTVDATIARAGRLGARHEQSILDEYVAEHGAFDASTGRGVIEIERPRVTSVAVLEAKHAETIDALRSGADVVFQGGFFDGRFAGWADFLVREGRDAPGPPRIAVYDTKLARHERPTALLQVTAYADQLLAAGIAVTDDVHLILGNRVRTSHRLADLLPVYRERRRRLEGLLLGHQDAAGPVVWGDPRYRACGRCDVCAPELESRRDVLLVAGLRLTQRARLNAAGIETVEQLAASTGPVAGVGVETLAKLRAQARMQAEQDADPADEHAVRFAVHDPSVIGHLPVPDAGDIFFDFEGDPLWSAGEVGPDGQPATWGLEYLFGVVEAPVGGQRPVFRPFWAHDRAQEKQALIDFLEYVQARRAQHPNLHVYHYAPYERTALLRLAGRHGVGEDVVDQLLREGVLVDLYQTVRASLRTGQRSYSLKKLEPLYMDVARSGEVTTAGDSIDEYAKACALRSDGDEAGWAAALHEIGEYNRYDCESTLGLRDWLLARAADAGIGPRAVPEPADEHDDGEGEAPERDALAGDLLAFADDETRFVGGARTPDQQAVALVAASLGYHWREHKPFWWEHYDRLKSDTAEWTGTRSVLIADEVQVAQDWHVPERRRTQSRELQVRGRLEPGSELRAGLDCYALYERPVPEHAKVSDAGSRGWVDQVTVTAVGSVEVDGEVVDELTVLERLRAVDAPFDALPMALVPGPPPSTRSAHEALIRSATQVVDALPGLPDQAALDLMRRRPPRTVSGRPLPTPGDGDDAMAEAISAAVRDLDSSYLAVQGPPGTGKTHTGSRVIADLVGRGWKVGVVAQSHAVVENLLGKVVEAGVDPRSVVKKPKGNKADPAVAWRQPTATGGFESFYATHTGGMVVGGTLWDFTTDGRIVPGGFDLLVIDEAGQFSLANTLAVSLAARNLLLLGDPQQLPQVAQGQHPEPVDVSALGWLTDGHDTLPPELGYFLAHTYRMHPALCARVSRLSYEGRLESVPSAAGRHLEGVPAGVSTVVVDHRDRAVASPEEADAVVAEVRAMLGRAWTEEAGAAPRPLEDGDFVVVAAYNAQVWTVREALDAAGLSGVRVGTVDKFQGQEAPVVIVSMAASSPEDVPRGMEFLLNRNRLNVAISRGQWAAVVVRSDRLTDYLPSTPERMAELGGFIGLYGG